MSERTTLPRSRLTRQDVARAAENDHQRLRGETPRSPTAFDVGEDLQRNPVRFARGEEVGRVSFSAGVCRHRGPAKARESCSRGRTRRCWRPRRRAETRSSKRPSRTAPNYRKQANSRPRIFIRQQGQQQYERCRQRNADGESVCGIVRPHCFLRS